MRNQIQYFYVACLVGLMGVVVLLGVGCGWYSFSGAVPGGIKTIAIPLFDNATSEYGIREQITDAVINRFLRDNIVKVVDLGRAEAILRGQITGVVDQPYTFQASETVQEYRVIVSVQISMENTQTGETVWSQEFSEWGTYPFSSGGSTERDQGIAEAIAKLTEDISNKVVSGW
jgi:outer membrane lipopolysaccharide assembly protein LptE/RlpB